MTEDITRWERRLREQRHHSRKLSAAMSAAALELRERGTEPPADLVAEIERYRTSFEELRSDLQARIADAGHADSLDELEHVLASQTQLQAALAVVDVASRLKHREVAGFPPLNRVWDQCRELREQLSTAPPARDTTEALIKGLHPLAALVQLVRDADTLSDEHWESLQEVVTAQFGRELATAVVRGRVAESAV